MRAMSRVGRGAGRWMGSGLLAAALLACDGCSGASPDQSATGTDVATDNPADGTATDCPAAVPAATGACALAATQALPSPLAEVQALASRDQLILLGDPTSTGEFATQGYLSQVDAEGVPGDYRPLTPPPGVRVGVRYAAGETAIYAVGGEKPESGGVADTAVQVARRGDDGAFGVFRSTLALPAARLRPAVVVGPRAIYVVGGTEARGGAPTVDVQVGFLAESGVVTAWRPGTPLPLARANPSAVVVKGHLFVYGERAGTEAQCRRDMLLAAPLGLDGTVGEFRVAEAGLPVVPVGAQLVAGEDRLLLVGGTADFGDRVDGQSVGSVLEARVADDGTLSNFRRVATLPDRRLNHAASVVSGRLFVLGGMTDIDPLSDAWRGTLTDAGIVCP